MVEGRHFVFVSKQCSYISTFDEFNNVCVALILIMFRALDKREYLMMTDDNFSYFSLKPYVVTPHLRRQCR